jgi:cardiolipin synthase
VTEIAIAAAVFIAHAAAISVLILYERRQPAATMAWLLALVLLPVFGLLAYLLIGTTRFRRTVRRGEVAARRIRKVRERLGVGRKIGQDGEERSIDERTESLLRLGEALAATGASPQNRVRLLVDGAATYRAILGAIEHALHHVHVEFYIIQPDETGRSLRERLVRAARRGVQVRLLYDAVGSSRLPRGFFAELEAVGGKVTPFRPALRVLARLRRRDRVDFRNHRKIVVVDGQLGFTGGINIGREYLGLDPEMGRWRDTHVEIEGPAVLSLQSAFAEDWFSATHETIDDDEHFPEPRCFDGGAIVQVVDSGPDSKWSPIEMVYASAIAHARERVWITNPYFVPSPTIEVALVAAALRGVDVRLLVPARSDNLVVQMAARSYFPRMLEAGARVFRYQRGFVHAKTMVVDDWVATVGSANMDMRSFQLNFELNPFVVDAAFAQALAAEFVADLRHADELRPADLERDNVLVRLLSGLARLLSPLL